MFGKLASLVALVSLAVTAAPACSKKAGGDPAANTNTDIGATFDPDKPTEPANKEPMTGVDSAKLSDANKARFEKLADSLPSPCGKAHSLRTSKNTDASCLRAPFAAQFVVELISDGASDPEVVEIYGVRYKEQKRHGFKLDPTRPRTGPDDAPVVIVEFFDYGCGACKVFAGPLAEVQRSMPDQLAIYYKMFPLSGHPDSGPAAQAALAAHAQGKFHEMHKVLFENSHAHKKPQLDGYAKQIGLDMAKFETDYAAAAKIVAADRNEGIALEIRGTPTTYINGTNYEGPLESAKYLKLWVDEELALAR